MTKMRSFPIPAQDDQRRYLLQLYFGSVADPIAACVGRAYLDMSRTLRGIAKLPDALRLRQQAHEQVRSALIGLPAAFAEGGDQDGFDGWHHAECDRLCDTYRRLGFRPFTIGQAQKWLNMALKYIFVFGEQELSGYSSVYNLGHIPLDTTILDQLVVLGALRLSARWSRLSDYDEYLSVQRWVRNEFRGSAPLAVEFDLWLRARSAVD